MPKQKSFSKPDIIYYRLLNQQILQTQFKSPGEITEHFGAVQAQDYAASKWAIGLRLQTAADNDIEKAIARREIVRTWLIRGTLHFVTAEDIYWMLTLTAPANKAGDSARDKQLGLNDKIQKKANKIFEKSLRGGKQLLREELTIELKRGGLKVNGMILSHLLQRAGKEQIICFGIKRGKEFTYTLLNEWVPKRKNISRDEALAELTKRYFNSHGPATITDFVWWSGLTKSDAKIGLEINKPGFISVTLNDQTYWMPKDLPDKKIKYPAYLLPWWDEYIVGYKDRSAILNLEHVKQVNAGGGMINPTVILNGRVTGIWKREIKKDKVIITIKAFREYSEKERNAVKQAANRYGAFIGLEPEIKI